MLTSWIKVSYQRLKIAFNCFGWYSRSIFRQEDGQFNNVNIRNVLCVINTDGEWFYRIFRIWKQLVTVMMLLYCIYVLFCSLCVLLHSNICWQILTNEMIEWCYAFNVWYITCGLDLSLDFMNTKNVNIALGIVLYFWRPLGELMT